ncbi:MAG TPA: IS5 family transposase [Rhizomicrobium sp.]|jgi:IS5 family transposase|nr:IS5 family transposase [Rhizomicrobium sp.]
MAERRVGQLSLGEGTVVAAVGSNEVLERIAVLVDWVPVEAVLHDLRSGPMGAPGYPSLVMFKALLLQRWYALSDPALEEALKDRLSFRRFIGVALSDPIPDHSTLWRFREALGDGRSAAVFAQIGRQIEASGFVLKQGTLIDASLVPAAINPPPRPKGDLPPDADGRAASKLVKSEHDPDAAWTKKNGKRYFGYKLHAAMDQTSRIIRGLVVTPANVNDTTVADALICGDEAIVYADKAYDSHTRSERLAELGIANGIMRRPNKWSKLGAADVARNQRLAKKRGAIEPLFSLFKNVYGLARARYRSLRRNAAAFTLAALAMNLKRWARHMPIAT